jgi:hypothetical protein
MSNRKNHRQQNNKRYTADLMLRDNSNGHWVVRLEKDVPLSTNKIPQSLIQITNNEIHYTDPNFIIQQILASRNREKLQNLESYYNTIMDSLENYKTYTSGIEKVFDYCERNSNEFDNKIREMSLSFDFNEFQNNLQKDWNFHKNKENIQNKINEYLAPFSAYIKVLFAYIHSALIIHKHKVKSESVIIVKICNLQGYAQTILEAILMPKNKAGRPSFDESIYLSLIFDNNFQGNILEKFLQYDRRFLSAPDLVRSAAQDTMRMDNKYQTIKLEGEFNKTNPESLAFLFANSILELLKDIESLKNIRLELNKIDNDKVLQDYQAITSPKTITSNSLS